MGLMEWFLPGTPGDQRGHERKILAGRDGLPSHSLFTQEHIMQRLTLKRPIWRTAILGSLVFCAGSAAFQK